MQFQEFIGHKFSAKARFDFFSGLYGLDLRGSFFYRTEIARQHLLDGLADNPLEVLKNISRYIEGAFTLIFIDTGKQEMWAVTDPYGLNKLFYHQKSGNVQLSDDLTDFLNVGQLNFSQTGLQEYLRFLDISPPETCFERVRILDGGTILKISMKTKNIEIVDCLSFPSPAGAVSFEDAIVKTHDLLIKGLVKRLEITDKIGLFLSGGVDSSLLAGALAEMGYKNNPDKIVAYTVGFDDSRLDESPIAQSVAAHLGIFHKVLKFDIEKEYQAFFEICGLLDVPFADPAVIPTYLSLQTMRADGVTGVMEGTGADGLIGASLPAFYHRVLKIDAVVPKTIRKLISSCLTKIGDPKGYLPYFDFDGPEERFIRWKGWTRPEIEKLCGRPCDFSDTAFYRAFREHRNEGAYELYRKLLINMPDYRITDTCRLMGFDPIFPFFDRDLRVFVEALPMDYKYRQGENKALYKALLAQMVPREIWDVPKHGFDYPFEKLLLYKDADLVTRYMNTEALRQHNFFDLTMVENYRQKFLAGDHSLKFKIWNLVVFQCWYEKFYMKKVGSV